MKKLLLLSLIILASCGDSDSSDENEIINPIDEISGEYLLDRFVASGNNQTMCPSFLSISEELYRMELNYKDRNSPVSTDCLPPYIYEFENIYVEGNEIRGASDGYVIKKFVLIDNELILFQPNVDNYLLSGQRFHFIKQ